MCHFFGGRASRQRLERPPRMQPAHSCRGQHARFQPTGVGAGDKTRRGFPGRGFDAALQVRSLKAEKGQVTREGRVALTGRPDGYQQDHKDR
jgi:hypothetical protein